MGLLVAKDSPDRGLRRVPGKPGQGAEAELVVGRPSDVDLPPVDQDHQAVAVIGFEIDAREYMVC